MISETYVFGGRLGTIFIGVCMLASVSACAKDEPTAPHEETTQQQTPSHPQLNEPNNFDNPSKSSKPTKHIVRGYASPEEAYEMCEQAQTQRSWVTALNCLTQEAQDNALLQLHLALAQLLRVQENANQFGPTSAVSTTKDSKEIALRSLKKKYATINASDNNMSSVVPTKYEYFGEIMDFFSTYGQSKKPKSNALTKVTIDGDTAVGTAVTSYETGEEKSRDIMFKRVNGKWFKDGEPSN